jgi:tetratricopeptide (TPR) repeat protein
LLSQRLGDENVGRLVEVIQAGECVLFLGAGVSIDSGAPTGQQLADELGKTFLGSEAGTYLLGEVSELIDANEGRKTLNEWLLRRFGPLKPAGALTDIPLFRWKSIYTVNFDTLLEAAYEEQPGRLQPLRVFYSDRDPLSRLEPNELAVYKLHGCLSRANSDDGHLVLTQEDELLVVDSRTRLFNRLLDDVSDFTVLYVGFKRHDPDFTKVILAVKKAAGTLLGLRRSYAVQPGHTAPEQRRWEKDRVQLFDISAAEFFDALKSSLDPKDRFRPPSTSGSGASRPLLLLKPKLTPSVLAQADRNFEVVDEAIRTQVPNAAEFFLGAPPNWGSIVGNVDAARDLADDVLNAVLVDPLTDRGGPKFVLIHAEAGTGKSTLVRRLGVDLALTWKQAVLALKPYGALDLADVEPLARQLTERVYVLVDDATDIVRELSRFLKEAASTGVKVTVIAGARTNEWRDAQADYAFPAAEEYELEALSRPEIERVLDTLERNQALGLLAGAGRGAQIAAFEMRAEKQLLVALREATEGKKFDDIVVDEFNSVPSADGQRAYLLISSLHRFGVFVRAALLYRALNIPLADLKEKVFDPTAKIIVARQALGDPESYYSARHQLVADIVFDRIVSSERRRLEYYSDLIKHLDIGFASDADAFRKLTRGKNRVLLHDFTRIENRRELMEQLLRIDPTDAIALQHAAMMEMEGGDLGAAARFLSRALELRPADPSIRDTEGRLLLRSATEETDPVVADGKFARAENAFVRNVQRQRTEPFGYRHLAETYVSWAQIQRTDEKRFAYARLGYQTVLDGISKCPSTSMLYQYLGVIEDSLGEPERARKAFRAALSVKPADVVTRFMAARLEERTNNPETALDLLIEGLATAAQDPELHYRIALLMAMHRSDRGDEINAHFEAAELGPARNYMPKLAHGAFLFSKGEYQRARNKFSELEDVVVGSEERFTAHWFRFGDLENRQTGRLIRRGYSFAIVEFDQGASNVFLPFRDLRREVARDFAVGRLITFRLAFNLKGPVALEPTVATSAKAS